jgi:menaquinone-dependent protoporphyrinogen oxidase
MVDFLSKLPVSIKAGSVEHHLVPWPLDQCQVWPPLRLRFPPPGGGGAAAGLGRIGVTRTSREATAVSKEAPSNDSPRPAKRGTTRRRFLLITGGVLGATVLLGGSALAVALQEPTTPNLSTSCARDGAAGGKVLVAYASKCGSTAEVAQAVAEELCRAGLPADVRPVQEVKDISTYRAVVLGSAARMGSLLAEAHDFAQRHQAALASLPTAYFTAGITMKQDTPANRETATGYFQTLRAIREPVSLGLFAGKMDHSQLAPVWRLAAQQEDKKGVMAEGDFRDWPAIRAWASSLAPLLTKA